LPAIWHKRHRSQASRQETPGKTYYIEFTRFPLAEKWETTATGLCTTPVPDQVDVMMTLLRNCIESARAPPRGQFSSYNHDDRIGRIGCFARLKKQAMKRLVASNSEAALGGRHASRRRAISSRM